MFLFELFECFNGLLLGNKYFLVALSPGQVVVSVVIRAEAVQGE